MGWTSTDLVRNRMTMMQTKKRHVQEASWINRDGVKAELIAHEWHRSTWFALIKMTFPPGVDARFPEGGTRTWLRVDLLDNSPGEFRYKDMSEEVGPYNDDPPSTQFAALIYQNIPTAEGYAIEWRKRNGVPFDPVPVATSV